MNDDFTKINEYHSPEKIKPYLSEIFFLKSRWSLYSHFFVRIFQSRPLAVKGLYDDDALSTQCQKLLKNVESCGGKFHITGLNFIDHPGPVVFAANHMSTLETAVLPGIINPRKKASFVVKKKLTQGPIWGPIMRSLEPIAVERKNPREDLELVYSEGVKHLNSGRSMIIFPQGTRREVFNRTEFNSLAIKLALKAQVPIVPIALKTDFWGRGKIISGFGKLNRKLPIYIEFGEPIIPQGRGKEAQELVLDFIEKRLLSWGAEVVL